MAAILNGLRALGSGRVLDEVLTLVMDSALEVTKAERGFMMLANIEGELEFKIARGRGKTTLSGTSFTTSEKIPREVFRTGQSRTVADLMEGDLAGQHDRTIAVGIRHVLCVPLRVAAMSAAAAVSLERPRASAIPSPSPVAFGCRFSISPCRGPRHASEGEVAMPVQLSVDDSKRVLAKGEMTLALTDYGVPVPSQLGVISMQDEVKVWIALQARAMGAEHAR